MRPTRRSFVGISAAAAVLPWALPGIVAALEPPPLGPKRLQFLDGLDRITDVPFAPVAGRPTIVTFFATWCPPCRPEFEALNRIRSRYDEAALAIVAINVFESFGGLSTKGSRRRFYGTTRPLFPVLDGNADAPDAFGGVTRIPTLMIFDRTGSPAFTFVHEDGSSQQYAGFDEINARVAPLVE